MNRARVSFALLCAALGAVTSVGCVGSEPEAAVSPETSATPAVAASVDVEQSQAGPKQTQSLDQNALEDRRGAVESEIGRLGCSHPWAGEYTSVGTDTSDRMAVAPETGYVVTHRGMGSRNGPAESIRECGRVRFVDGKLILEPEFSNSGDLSTRPGLVSVRWGDRRYLLYERSVPGFCNSVNSGDEQFRPSRGTWTRTRDAVVTGKPELSGSYQALIFDEPLVAKVVSRFEGERTDRAGNSYQVGVIVLDVGRNHGAFEKMRLYRDAPGGNVATVDIVHETTCEATCTGGGPDFVEPPVGTEFSTRRPSK